MREGEIGKAPGDISFARLARASVITGDKSPPLIRARRAQAQASEQRTWRKCERARGARGERVRRERERERRWVGKGS